MRDLLERLRGWSSDPLCREAAAEIETLNLAFCNAVTRCEGAEATLSERTYERDNAVRAAQEQAQAVVDAHAEIARLRFYETKLEAEVTNGSELYRFFSDRAKLVEMLEGWANYIGTEHELNAGEFAEQLIRTGFRRQP